MARHGALATSILLALMLVGSARALDGFESCAASVRSEPEDLEAYRCFWQEARRQSRPREALAALEALAAERGEDPRIDLYRAAILGDLEDPQQRSRLERAVAGCETKEVWDCATFARLSLAWLDRADPERAWASLAAADRAAQRDGDPELTARVAIGKGWRAIADEDFVRARAELLAARSALEPEGPFDARYRTLDGLGFVAWATGRMDEAAESYRRALRLAEDAEDRYWAASARYNVLLAEQAADAERGELGARVGVQQLEETIAEALRAGNRGAEASLRLQLAQVVDDPDRRAAELAAAADIALAAGDPTTAAMSHWVRANDLADSGRFEAATAELEKAEAAVARAAERGLALRQCIAGADLLWRQGLAPDAHARSLECLTRLDEVLRRQPVALDRAGVKRHFVASAYALSQQLAQEGEIELGLATIEKLRIGSVLAGWAAGSGDPELDALRREIAALQREGSDRDTDPTEPRARARRLEELEAGEQERLIALGALAERPLAIPTLEQLRAALDDHTAILSFQVSPWSFRHRPESWSWVAEIDAEAVRAVMLPHPLEIDEARAAFRGLLARDDEPARAASVALYRLLLDQALARLPSRIERLVLVPDGPLHEVPVAALRATTEAPALGERYEIVRATSLASWAARRGSSEEPLPGRVLSLADPELPSAAAVPARDRLGSAELAGLGRLPGAREEAQTLGATFGEASAVLVGIAASEAALKHVDLAAIGLLHVAAHALVDPLRPYRSSILLAPGGGEDGLLQLRDVSALELRGAIVVLAACRSADGSMPGGPGVFSLARALLDAGASAVVANLEPVADADSRRLLEPLFRELARGEPVGTALLSARRLAARHHPPAAWATTILLGDADARLAPVPRSPRLRQLAPALALALLLAAGVAVAFRRARRRP